MVSPPARWMGCGSTSITGARTQFRVKNEAGRVFRLGWVGGGRGGGGLGWVVLSGGRVDEQSKEDGPFFSFPEGERGKVQKNVDHR